MTELELVEFIKQKQEEGMGDTKIANLLGTYREKIRGIRRKYNISPMEKKIEYTKDELLHLIEPHQNKYKSLREFIENVGINKYKLEKYMKMYDIKFIPSIKCNNCGVEIEGSFEKGKGHFCSEECYMEFDRKKSRENYWKRAKEENRTKSCKFCGNEFTPSKHYTHYCSDSCKEEGYIVTRKESGKKTHNRIETRICESCGKEFEVKHGSSKKICSPQCRGGLINYKIQQSLFNLFKTNNKQEIKEIVRRSLDVYNRNESA